jgi:hypothetical protein
MKAFDQPTTTEITTQLEQESASDSKISVLQPLNSALIFLSFIGFIISLIPPQPTLVSLSVIFFSLTLNLFVFWLIKIRAIMLASYIFCIWLNIGVFYFICSNLFEESNIPLSIIFSCVLALCSLLAGILLGKHVSVILTFINTTLVISIYLIYYRFYVDVVPAGEVTATMILVPLSFFLLMVAVTSYLYQLALDRKDARLRMARERIMQDELLRQEMQLARELQERLSPPSPPPHTGITVAALSQPAYETSGDFYDYIAFDDQRFSIIVADVTGKGLVATLGMTMTRTAIRSEARRHVSPGEVLKQANLTLYNDHAHRLMATCFYGVLDVATLQLRFASAGHPYPLVRRAGKLLEYGAGGYPLGASEDSEFEDVFVQLQPGDQLILMTDGAFEERNEERELFGFERMNAALVAVTDDDPKMTVQNLRDVIEQFRGSREQSDDLTLVAIQFHARAQAVGIPLDLHLKGPEPVQPALGMPYMTPPPASENK